MERMHLDKRSGGINCNVTMSGNTTVTANYNQAGITSITVAPSTATIGAQQQFTATVNGTGSYSSSVTWSLTCPSCGSLSSGTLSATRPLHHTVSGAGIRNHNRNQHHDRVHERERQRDRHLESTGDGDRPGTGRGRGHARQHRAKIRTPSAHTCME